jgi:hypothetical protein
MPAAPWWHSFIQIDGGQRQSFIQSNGTLCHNKSPLENDTLLP